MEQYDNCFEILDYFSKKDKIFDNHLIDVEYIIKLAKKENSTNSRYKILTDKFYINYYNDIIVSYYNFIIVCVLNIADQNYNSIPKKLDNINKYILNKLLIHTNSDNIYEIKKNINKLKKNNFNIIFISDFPGINTILKAYFNGFILIKLINYLSMENQYSNIINQLYHFPSFNYLLLNDINYTRLKNFYYSVMCSGDSKQNKKLSILALYYLISNNATDIDNITKFITNIPNILNNINNKYTRYSINNLASKVKKIIDITISDYNYTGVSTSNIIIFEKDNNLFNDDLELIQKYVEYKNSYSIELGKEIFAYYDERIDKYMKKIAEVYGLDYVDNKLVYTEEKMKIIENNHIGVYRHEFDKLENLLRDFKKTYTVTKVNNKPIVTDVHNIFSSESIIYLIESIVDIISYVDTSEVYNFFNYRTEFMYDIRTINDEIFFLMNDKGLFGINTYLYSFFNGIHLFGVPIESNVADSVLIDPKTFMEHDTFHSNNIMISILYTNKEVFSLYKYIYYKILNSLKINEDYKKKLLLFMWLLIHEYNQIIIPNDMSVKIKTTSNFNILDNNNMILLTILLDGFFDFFNDIKFDESIYEKLKRDSSNVTVKLYDEAYDSVINAKNESFTERFSGNYTYADLELMIEVICTNFSMYITEMVNIFKNINQFLEEGL